MASVVVLFPLSGVLAACDSKVEGPGNGEAGSDDLGDDPDGDADGTDPDSDGSEPDSSEPDDPAEPSDPPSEPPPEPKPEAATPCDWDAPWGGYACTTDDDQEGTNFCLLIEGEEFWTPCSTEAPECEPGEGIDMGCLGEICYWDGQDFRWYAWSEPDCNTPLVLDFEGVSIDFMPATAASFDLSTDGTCMSTDWPTAPWLALDRDGDGFIRDSSELFGNATPMAAGGYAPHGFAALAELDTNRDGKISAEDERFGELVLWSDLDEDRIGAYAELRTLSELSLVSIDLGFRRRPTCDGRGNCGYERTSFEYRTAQGSIRTGEVVDVHLACR